MMRAAKPSGFTLIELLVVVAITAILAMLAAPSFSSWLARQRLEGAANEMSVDLQYARTQAVTDNANVLFQTTSATQYSISAASGTPNYKTVNFDTATGLTVTAGVRIVFTPMRACLQNNNCSALSPASIVITNGAGSLQATVNYLGRVSLCVPSGSFAGYPSC